MTYWHLIPCKSSYEYVTRINGIFNKKHRRNIFFFSLLNITQTKNLLNQIILITVWCLQWFFLLCCLRNGNLRRNIFQNIREKLLHFSFMTNTKSKIYKKKSSSLVLVRGKWKKWAIFAISQALRLWIVVEFVLVILVVSLQQKKKTKHGWKGDKKWKF